MHSFSYKETTGKRHYVDVATAETILLQTLVRQIFDHQGDDSMFAPTKHVLIPIIYI